MRTETREPTTPDGVEVVGRMAPGYEEVLTPEALGFVADLVRNFGERRDELLARRREQQALFDAGELPDFLEETASPFHLNRSRERKS